MPEIEHKYVTIVYLNIFQNSHLLKHNFMKKISTLTIIAVFITLYSNGISAQTTQAGFNQVELMKQFIGTWKNETNKDTVYTAEFKPYGNGGLEFTLRSVTQGKVWLEMKQLWGYDKKSDKIVVAGLMKDDPNLMLQATWFTAKNKCEQVPLEFASNPEQAGFIVKFEIKSPDLVLRNEIVNNKSLGVETYSRVK
jgi:hypothetical protein